MLDPDAGLLRPQRSLIYFGACIIAGLRLAREKQVNIGVVPISQAIDNPKNGSHLANRAQVSRNFWGLRRMIFATI